MRAGAARGWPAALPRERREAARDVPERVVADEVLPSAGAGDSSDHWPT